MGLVIGLRSGPCGMRLSISTFHVFALQVMLQPLEHPSGVPRADAGRQRRDATATPRTETRRPRRRPSVIQLHNELHGAFGKARRRAEQNRRPRRAAPRRRDGRGALNI